MVIDIIFYLGIIFGTLVLYRCFTIYALVNKTPAPAVETKVIAEMCPVWDIRHTQKKMLEAGIIGELDLIICENNDCPECFDTRRKIRWAEEKVPPNPGIKEMGEKMKGAFSARPPKGSAGIGGRHRMSDYRRKAILSVPTATWHAAGDTLTVSDAHVGNCHCYEVHETSGLRPGPRIP